ncbi:MAG: TM2 domain-containing protein [Cyclobacteriaceae bacterium]
MNKMLKLFPELANLDMEEMNYIKGCIKDMDEETMETFANIYRAQRRDPQTVLALCLAGLFLLPGLQRFYLGQIGMGILYLFTIGICFVGSIVDLVKYKRLALEYNMKTAQNIMTVIKIETA